MLPSTTIELVSRLTEQVLTPSNLDTAFSTRAEQAAQQAINEFNGANETLSQVKEELNNQMDESSEERLYKNEAYAFILSEGLLDKFLDFREPLHRTRSQEIHYTLTTASDLPGEWIAE